MSAGSVAPQLAPTGAAASERWYAVWTRSQCEPKVEEGLRRRRFEVFLPRVSVSSRRRDRRLVLARPLFPGYVFLRFAPSREGYIRVASTDGVVRIIGERWDSLYPIPDGQVEAVRRLVTSGDRARAVPWIGAGAPGSGDVRRECRLATAQCGGGGGGRGGREGVMAPG